MGRDSIAAKDLSFSGVFSEVRGSGSHGSEAKFIAILENSLKSCL